MTRPTAWTVLTDAVPADTQRAFARFKNPVVRPPPWQRNQDFDGVEKSMRQPPDKLDWRKKGVLSDVRHQGPANTCTSFSIAAAMEARLRISRRPVVRLAPGFIHTCLFRLEAEDGLWADNALEEVKKSGVARGFDADYPFPQTACRTRELERIRDYASFPTASDAMLAMERGPVIADMWIDPSFLSLKRASIYTYEASPVAVLHTVVLVGYDAAKETWLIQNSLGEGWCDGGFGLISFGSGGLLGGTAGGRWGWEIRVK